jgi:NAD(P)-dependent dehydrogenase (short-subunit alcohol dehydrogenase family)
MLSAVWERFGGVDVLVNNAGGQFAAHAMDFTDKGWNAVIDTNLNGSWYMMQGAAKRWVAQGRPGNIVNITAAIERGLTGMAHTTASRAGVIALSRTLAVEWAEHNIRVNCIGAGAIESNGFNNYREENVATFYQCNPMKRPVTYRTSPKRWSTSPRPPASSSPASCSISRAACCCGANSGRRASRTTSRSIHHERAGTGSVGQLFPRTVSATGRV